MRANFVLWTDGQDFHVSQRIGPKRESELKEHFVNFFHTEEAAWKEAEIRQKNRIEWLQGYVKRYRKNRIKASKR